MVRLLLAVLLVVVLSAMAAQAADPPAGIAGLFVTTKYPALTVRAGETTTIDVSVRNFKLPPQSLILSVPQIATGWKATVLGGGQPVGNHFLEAVDIWLRSPNGRLRRSLAHNRDRGNHKQPNRKNTCLKH